MIPRPFLHPALPVLALLAVVPTGAGAKDLPRGAAAPHGAVPCAAFGPGYIQVGGSDTCVRVSGSVSLESSIVSTGSRGVGAFMSAPRR